jgi:hypothetical protein
MKTKDELLGKYRDLVENSARHKDTVFLEVLIDIRDAVSALHKEMRTKQDGHEGSTG